MSIRVVLVEDNRSMRETIIELLEKEPGIEVIAEAADGQSALLLVRDVNPDVVVMGVFLPRMNGIQATGFIVSEYPNTRVILMSMHFEREFVDYPFRVGASGFVLKDNACSEMAHAIREVMEGRTYRGRGVDETLSEE